MSEKTEVIRRLTALCMAVVAGVSVGNWLNGDSGLTALYSVSGAVFAWLWALEL